MSDSGQNPADRPPARARDRAPEGRSVLDIVRVADRLDVVEEMLSGMQPPSVIASKLMSMGLPRDLANRYQAAVRMRWQRNGRMEGREGRVMRYREALEAQVRKADEEGDRKAAIAGLGLLLKLEGEAPAPNDPALPANAGVVLTDGSTLAEPVAVDAADAAAELRRRRAAGK
jgi:hypothetical protein